MSVQRSKITVTGIVQGVGFRPFVFQLAQRFHLHGTVCNDTRGVTIEVEGHGPTLDRFVTALSEEKPPLAVIHSIAREAIPVQGATSFAIVKSRLDDVRSAQIAPDTFVCDDCLRELFDPADRRYHYPFINCTNCGPRYTIVTDVPYDRPLTTMADFPLCVDCRAEYDDPSSRRFHAQPNACGACGPRLQLFDATGQPVDDSDPFAAALNRLQAGEIVAIKGLGGYHLAVDAANEAAVLTLRRRKARDEKPFAIMVKDVASARRVARVGDEEARFLEGPERPIVLLNQKDGHGLAAAIAPDNRCFGIMLPYTPLHHLLFAEGFKALVMTSANLSEEPIAYEDEEARRRLTGIADAYLGHDRRIHTRTDDSIARWMAGRALLLRRSRGFVPRAIMLPTARRNVLAVGAELKNTICLTRGDAAFLSQHIGDLKNLEVSASFRATIRHLTTLLEAHPDCVAHDLHPDYDSTRYAVAESGLEAVAVQHHHAHLASCLAEHGIAEPAIGVIFDGIGYGMDGHIWGGEFLVGDLQTFERVGHFRYQPMPGGDLATREPWRMALSYLQTLYGQLPEGLQVFDGIAEQDLRLVSQAAAKRINAPLTSSCGRLFDAVAALLGLRQKVSFEGQAAMALEMIADPHQNKDYPCLLEEEGGQLIYDPKPMMAAILDDHLAGRPVAEIAGRFHWSLARMIGMTCRELRQRTGLDRVVLSGGVFQNVLLTELTVPVLEEAGFEVLTHSLVPPNDGGLALGQAAVAAIKSPASSPA